MTLSECIGLARPSHIHDYHLQHAKLTEFSGFDMPLWYTSIVDEHLAVRNSAGLFDVSHMGRVSIEGPGATEFISKLLPTNPSKVKDFRAFYSVICNESGGIIDDVITNKFSSHKYLMVINAGNREKDLLWFKNTSQGYDLTIRDISDSTALIALQGPKAEAILQEIVDNDLSSIKRFTFCGCRIADEPCLLSRTGYTGEDGFEITVFDTPLEKPEKALSVWTRLLEVGKKQGLVPCGLGARDTLRLEAGMCLYGQDIDETTTPVEASLDGLIELDQRDFIGKSIFASQMKNGVQKKRIAFSMLDQGIPRHGFDVLFSRLKVGHVTSGTFSPLLKRGIGMAYVPPPLSVLGHRVSIQIRNDEKAAEIVRTPFYDTTKYGYKRAK